MSKLVGFVMVFVLGLSTGVFVSFFLQNESTTISESTPVDGVPLGSAEPDRPAPRRTLSERPRQPEEVVPPNSGLDRLDFPEIPLLNESGDRFRIEGRVVDPAGRPVSGVVIRSEMNVNYSELPAALMNPMPGVHRDTFFARRSQFERAIHARTRIEVTSDDDGRFVLENLLNGREYSVSGTKTGCFVHDNSKWHEAVTIGSRSPAIHLIAWPAHRIRCHVEFDDGQPLERAIIEISEAEQDIDEWDWTKEAPDIWLIEGTMKFRAFLDGNYDSQSSQRLVKVPVPEDEQPVVFKINRATGIELTVQASPDDPLRQFLVSAALAPDSNTPAEEILRRAEQNTLLSGPERTLRFTGLTPGHWIVGLRDGTEVLASTLVEVKKASMVPVTLKLPDRNPADHVVVRVLDPEGRLTHDANLEADPFIATKRLDGSFWVSRKPISEEHLDEDSTRYTMTVSSSVYGEKPFLFVPDGPAEITVQFDQPAEVRVCIEGYERFGPAPHYRISMWLSIEHDGVIISRGQKLDFDNMENVWTIVTQPGIARFHVAVSGEDRERLTECDVVEHTLRSGRNEITLSTPTLSTLTILFEDDREHSTVQVSKGDDTWRGSGREVPVENSKAVISFLPHGRYTLSVWNTKNSHPKEWMSVDITGPVTIRWKTIHRNALRMRFGGDDLPLRLAGFMDGDIVVGADGEEWTQDPADSFRGLLTYKKKVRFQVLRLGKPLDLDVDSIPLRDLFISESIEEIERP